MSQTRPGSLFWVAATTAAATIVLQALGSVVYTTGSSLACPDWPLCHGQLMPRMVGGVAIEHSHRLLAAAVVIGTGVLAVLAHRGRRCDRVSARMAWLAVGLVLLQAGLGAATVLLGLSHVASVFHLAVSMLFLTTLTVVAARAWRGARAPRPVPAAARRLARVAWGLTFVQIVLGGAVRHTGASAVCGTDPVLCAGRWWPGHLLGALHMAHRVSALVVAVAIVALAVVVHRRAAKQVGTFGRALVALVIFQIGLGALAVATALSSAVVMLHVAGAGALLVGLTALAGRGGSVAEKPAGESDPSRHADDQNEPVHLQPDPHAGRATQ